jgi:hypothetical protein
MQLKSDAQLVREYARNGSENAFTEIVNRHTNLVYSCAIRQVGSQDVAAEIAQNVFIGLARGGSALSPQLSENASLVGCAARPEIYRSTSGAMSFAANHAKGRPWKFSMPHRKSRWTGNGCATCWTR